MQREFQPTVYLLASRKNGALYTGVTSDLVKRVHEHREGVVPGFTKIREGLSGCFRPIAGVQGRAVRSPPHREQERLGQGRPIRKEPHRATNTDSRHAGQRGHANSTRMIATKKINEIK